MKQRKAVHFMSAGAVVLGLALCVPSAMLAQNDNAGAAAPQSDTQGSMPMGRHHHRPPSPERQLERLTKALNLTQEQQSQILPILQDNQQKMKALHEDTSMSEQDRRQQMRQSMMDTHQKIEAVLTDTQKQQFEQMMQRRRERWNGQRGMGQGPGAGTPPPPPPQ